MKRTDDSALALFTWFLSTIVGIIFFGLVARAAVFLFCLGYGC